MVDLIQKPILFITPADIHTMHASHLVVQPLPGRYLLSFFEVIPPLIMGTTDAERQVDWGKVANIPATCVARLVIADVDLAGFIHVLQQQQTAMKQQAVQHFQAFT